LGIDKEEYIQKDIYYDTDDKLLFNKNSTLRIRNKKGAFYVTVKIPVTIKKDENNLSNEIMQSERFEHEIKVQSDRIDDNKEYIQNYISELKDNRSWKRLNKVLIIENNRKKRMLYNGNVKFEIVYDDVRYIDFSENERHDYQIEIELKSDYPHKVNLKLFTDYLEAEVPELKPTMQSKLKRGFELLSK
jgi:inorganic triphosphatase YgiF